MSGFKDLKIYQIAFELALKVHFAALKLPKFELYEQGSQIRRSSKGVKDTISEGYGRRKYKQEYIRYLIFAQASCDEVHGQLDMLIKTYPENKEFPELLKPYITLGKRINTYIQYVQKNWKT